MKQIVYKSVAAIYVFALLMIIIVVLSGSSVYVYASQVEECVDDAKLEVNITSEDGVGIMNAKSSILMINSSILLTIPEDCAGNDASVSISSSDGMVNISEKMGEAGYFLDKEILEEDKEYDIKVEANEEGKRASSNIIKVMLDTVYPSIEAGYDDSNWYSQIQNVSFKITDDKALARVVVMEGNECKYEWHADDEDRTELTFSVEASKESTESSGQKVVVSAMDKSGNMSSAEYVYYLDASAPSIAVMGPAYDETLCGPTSVKVTTSDNNPQAAVVGYELIRTYDGVKEVSNKEIPIGDTDGTLEVELSDDGDYEYTVYAYDCAGNHSESIKGKCRVDTSDTDIVFSGVENSGVYGTDVTLKIEVNENFYDDVSVSVRGIRHVPNEDIPIPLEDFVCASTKSSMMIMIDKNGKYEFIVDVAEKTGKNTHKEIEFTVDKDKPQLFFEGLPEGNITNGIVNCTAVGNCFFFDKCNIVNKIYKKNMFNSYELVATDTEKMHSAGDTCSSEVKDEGAYRIVSEMQKDGKVIAKCEEDLIIDRKAPVVRYTAALNHKYFKGLHIPADLNQKVIDDGNVSFRKFLNSEEFEEDIDLNKDGKYVLFVQACDEAGNYTDSSCEFIIDNTCPVVVLKGISPDKTVSPGDVIEIATKDDEDYLKSVILDGNEMGLSADNKTCRIEADDLNTHLLEITAEDQAGNVACKQLRYSGRRLIDLSKKDIKSEGEITYSGLTLPFSKGQNSLFNIIGIFAIFIGTTGLSYRLKSPKNGHLSNTSD